MALELTVNTSTTQILVGNKKESLYFHNNPNRIHSLLSESTLLGQIIAKFVLYQNPVAGT